VLPLTSSLFRVVRVPSLGRGLFALRDLPAGTVVHTEAPLVSTPPASKLSDGSWCSSCCSPGKVCGHDDAAKKNGRGITDGVDFSRLYAYCREKRLKFPLLLKNLAGWTLESAASGHAVARKTNETEVEDETGEKTGEKHTGDSMANMSPIERMKLLCSVRLGDGPERHWLEEQRGMLVGCLRDAGLGSLTDVLDERWYVENYSRIMANAFRLDLVDTSSLQRAGGYRQGLRSLFVDQQEGANGSAVYTVASMFNHSCVPCVDVRFPQNNHFIEMRTNQDVVEGQQLCISYIDSEGLDVTERRAALLQGYGFVCQCPKCKEERHIKE
jgi:hypothetical protein